MTTDSGDRVLSVSEAVVWIEEHYRLRLSARNLRRHLVRGDWPMTRTAAGHYGIRLPSPVALLSPEGD